MPTSSKDKIISESQSSKATVARDLRTEGKLHEAIEMYHKVLFLKEDPQYMSELAEIYEALMDLSSAVTFYRRVHQLNGSFQAHEKVKTLTKIQGLQLLEVGSVKNILEDTEFEPFVKRYPAFHRKLVKKAGEKPVVSDYLMTCLAYLEVNQRQLALSEIENCMMIEEKDADLVVMQGLILWSLMETKKGYEAFWVAYGLERGSYEVGMFLEMITPELETLYKEAKYDLIDRKNEKCGLKVKKGL